MVKFNIIYDDLNAGGAAEADDAIPNESQNLRCFGPCSGTCKADCAGKGFKNGFCVQQGSLYQCCCL